MITGTPHTLAIESEIYEVSDRPSLRGLGYFVIHISGERFGVKSPNATMLANSFDEVCRRISERGSHVAPFATGLNADQLASTIQSVVYGDLPTSQAVDEITKVINTQRLLWAPDGDEAFDDGTVIAQLDVGDKVRLVAFRNCSPLSNGPQCVRELWMDADEYYKTLRQWSDTFLSDWTMRVNA